MESLHFQLSELFAQLGLANRPRDIDRFIAEHRGMQSDMALADAHFWQPAQAEFIRSALKDDNEWAEVVDLLNLQLR